MDSLELKDTKAQLVKRAKSLIDNCREEIRFFTDDEQKEFNDILKSIKNLNQELISLDLRLNNSKEEIKEIRTQIKVKEKNMEKRFSLVSAIRDIANNRVMSDVNAGILDYGKEEMRRAGLSMGGQIQLPVNELRAITVASEGEDIIPTDLFDIMAPLYSKNVLVQAGASFLTNLKGDVQVPIMTSGNVGWAGELQAASAKNDTFSHATLTPHRITAFIDISKQTLAQDAIGVENLIRQNIINALNAKLEATILGNGDGKEGGSTQIAPKGMFNGKTTIKSVTTMAKVADVEASVEEANIYGECKWIISPKFKSTLRSKAKGENIAESLYSHGEIDGTPALSTTHVGDHLAIYGDWSNLAIGQWGPIDLTIDNFTQAVNGAVRLVINAYFDAVVLRDGAFVFATTAAS